MKTIYFIRHGEGYHNLGKKGNYHLKYPRLTVKGINQCKQVREQLKTIDFDMIFVSPLRRTLETSEFIFGEDVNSTSLECIREFIYNPCDYREPIKDIISDFNYVNFHVIDDNYDYNKKENETMFNDRMKVFFGNLQNCKYSRIAVVSHGEFLLRFFKKYGKILGIDNLNYMKNCEVRTGVMYRWFRLKCTFRGNKNKLYLNAEKGYVSIFDTKKHWWSARWRMEEFGNQCFQLICMNTGEKKGGDKCLTVINNELTIRNLNDCDNVGVWKMELVEKNWFVLNYYKLEDLVSQTIEKENFVGRLEYDTISNKMMLVNDPSMINTRWKESII